MVSTILTYSHFRVKSIGCFFLFLLKKERPPTIVSIQKTIGGQMDKEHVTTIVCTNQDRSKGGKTRAKNLSAQERKDIATKASHSRKCFKDLPKASHSGELEIGNVKISCAVLEDGRRVITESSVFDLLKKSRKGRKTGRTHLPAFLSPLNLRPFISKELEADLNSFEYLHPQRGKVKGVDALLSPKICKVYTDAQFAGVVLDSQLPSVYQAYVITQALAQVGIISLVDESSGFQKEREHNELQQLFAKFIAKELQPWVKRFPTEFFENIKRIYGLEHLKSTPSFAGHLINRYIYNELGEEIFNELKSRNPLDDKGRRKHKHHQLLTTDIGCPALEKQVLKINTIMSVSETKEEFEDLFVKSKR